MKHITRCKICNSAECVIEGIKEAGNTRSFNT